ncbi:ComF family protein [Corynebacterium sp. zg254]|uniref:ComF family protein n=1 Tax=Corynebacterium zhongnanshanii TaxID=2768834 RepID=A0ABQ6VFB1_9CORY|nr:MULTISPECIES: ComF family protein [Corynebacterium]KAB3522980.1 ComF family protein [Corynebacterium zhongnanshanii]MCR5913937.1 ComF family protein [Corynebacterium sp. zg254]
MWGDIADLVLRADCVCCGRLVGSGHPACPECLADLSAPWQRWDPPVAVAPVYAAGAYGGPRRSLVIAAKDRLRAAAIDLMGRMYYTGLQGIASRGVVPDPRLGPVALLPAPTRRSAEKNRGGDVVTRAALITRALHSARHPQASANIGVFQLAHVNERARDSVGLGRQQRRSNIAASIDMHPERVSSAREYLSRGARVVIVDDVLTTGATSAHFALSLASVGIVVDAILVLAAV